MLKFLIYLLALTLLVSAVIYEGYSNGFFLVPSYRWEIILYMAFSTTAVFNFLRKKSGPILFTQLYLLTIVLKILTGSIFILVVIFMDRQGASGNAILFIIAYILFTTLEVGFLYRNVSELRP